MNQNLVTSPFSDIRLASASVVDGVWIVEAQKFSTEAACPRCQVVSSARHSSYQRRLWDLPIQGRPVRITLTVGRPIRGYRANAGRRFTTDILQPDSTSKDEDRDLTHVSGRPFLLAAFFAKVRAIMMQA